MAVGDFNGDNHLDLVVADQGSSTVSILLGNGDGTFQAPQSYAVDGWPSFVAVGDFNGDGIPDLAVAENVPNEAYQSGEVQVFLGTGDGSFIAAQNYALASVYASSVVVGDFDGDGHLDIAVANLYVASFTDGDGTVSILLGEGNGSFQSPRTYYFGGGPQSVAVGDFNGDSFPDLAVASSPDLPSIIPDSVIVLLNAADW